MHRSVLLSKTLWRQRGERPCTKRDREMFAKAVITLMERGTLAQLAALNDVSAAELETLRNQIGIYPEGYIALAPAPTWPSAIELLEKRLIGDWKTLKS